MTKLQIAEYNIGYEQNEAYGDFKEWWYDICWEI
jgi:hypothetical protein